MTVPQFPQVHPEYGELSTPDDFVAELSTITATIEAHKQGRWHTPIADLDADELAREILDALQRDLTADQPQEDTWLK